MAGYKDYQVIVNFNDGTNSYDLPHIQNISDPIAGIKANVIKGTRSDGAVVIPGGKKTIEINIKGIIWSTLGFADLMSQVNAMRDNLTTFPATLTLAHYDPDTTSWVTDWAFSVQRIEDIVFGTSMRTEKIDYDCKFVVTNY